MLCFIPLCSLSAISLAVYQAVLIPVIILGMTDELTEEEKMSQALLACVGLGVGEVIGGLTFGKVNDRFGTKVATIMCLFEWIAAVVVAVMYTLNN
jgi:MFS family permease